MPLTQSIAVLYAEIRELDLLARERSGPAFKRHAAFLQTIDTVRDRKRAIDVLLDDDQRGAARAHPRQRRIDVANDDRGQTKTDLVAQQQIGISHQCAADRSHLLLSPRQ